MKIEFDSERMSRYQKTVAKYEEKKSALLPTLYLAQEQFGFLAGPVMDYVAKLLDMAPASVYEAVTFYSMFKKKDMGKYCVQICNNITCTMMGSEDLIQVAREELGLGLNEVSSDLRFSVIPVQCLGSCDTAPVVQLNEDYVEKLNPERFRELLRSLKTTTPGKTAPNEMVTS